eukprot:TRINITY_DN23301_c0_g2_i2.p1 TRINITY_DN23301_c0_g2~~TRINITY_DN23301_c0_g2_i2.p1  ORF type:complete len:793 (+),score=87.06 TRINITY_DN23301_c0_g2_i2:62-2440(+)
MLVHSWRASVILSFACLMHCGLGFSTEHAMQCENALDCSQMRPLLEYHGGSTVWDFCSRIQGLATELLRWSWPSFQQKAVDKVLMGMCSKCGAATFQANEEYSSAVSCLGFAADYMIRMLKWASNYEAASLLFSAAKSSFPDVFDVWHDVHETPYRTLWNVDENHFPTLRPPRGGWWPLDHAGVWPIVQALRRSTSQVADEFQLARAEIDSNFAEGGPQSERIGWGGVELWTRAAGYSEIAKSHLRNICDALRDLFDLLPTAKRHSPFQQKESVSLQRISPGGFLLPHNDPERVSIMLCLSNCAGAWLQLANERRFFGHVGTILAFDNIIDHSAGNYGPNDRWVLNVVISHPDLDMLNKNHSDRIEVPADDKTEISEGELARGLLGSAGSKALLRIRALAGTFDCIEGRPGKLPPELTNSAYVLQHNSKLTMSDINWSANSIRFHFRMLRHFVEMPISSSSVQEAKAGCQSLRNLFGLDSLIGLTSLVEGMSSCAISEANRTLKPLPVWVLPGGGVDDKLARDATRDVVSWHIGRLHMNLAALSHDSHADSMMRGHQLVIDAFAVMLEHVLVLQLINAFAVAVERGIGDGMPRISGLPPATFYGSALADRVGVVVEALGSWAHDSERLFVEVGMYNGSFALGFLRNSRMQYLGVDPYSVEGGSFKESAAGDVMFQDVSAQINAFAALSGRAARVARRPSLDAAANLHASGESPDAVLVDAGHYYADVHADLHAWWSLLKPGGILFGHDFDAGSGDVMLAVGVFCQEVACSQVNLGADSIFWVEKPVDGAAVG